MNPNYNQAKAVQEIATAAVQIVLGVGAIIVALMEANNMANGGNGGPPAIR